MAAAAFPTLPHLTSGRKDLFDNHVALIRKNIEMNLDLYNEHTMVANTITSKIRDIKANILTHPTLTNVERLQEKLVHHMKASAQAYERAESLEGYLKSIIQKQEAAEEENRDTFGEWWNWWLS